VSSSWTQPTVTCEAANSVSSLWVGLDSDDGTQTVEQTGTHVNLIGADLTYASLFEAMWAVDTPVPEGWN
jgi:hypothetical protein